MPLAARGLTSSLLPGCTYAQSTAATLVFTLLAAVFSAVLDIGLMIMILWARRRRFRGAEAPLVRKIYRDALAYFGIQLITHIISIILWFTLPDPLKDIPPA
ncbi:hypothetical protein D9756_005713 [Leucocoprinus leucothites]|uniref:Uncharacterized protein n=1 Tax=Leucocoprinus leucothites TaxID=201217 RepID=A0A8H5G080_9AGAR|nr:hypothetical protein D9756_005713 [Leucoagaricus leucothites]